MEFETKHFWIQVRYPEITLFDMERGKIICDKKEYFEKTLALIAEPFQIDKDELLDYACDNNYRYLIKSVFSTPELLNRVLVETCARGQIDLMKYAIELGADIHVNFEESLKKAIYTYLLEPVKYLCENGADISYIKRWINGYNVPLAKEIETYLNSFPD